MTKNVSLHCVHDALFSIKAFLDKCSDVGNAHMVDYFVHDHWNTIVEKDLRTNLLSLSISELRLLVLHVFSRENFNTDECFFLSYPHRLQGLCAYLEEVRRCRQIFSSVLTKISDVFSALEVSPFPARSSSMKIESKEYMCTKKSHEVAKMSPVVNHICRHCETDSVLDVGSGKGYLSAFLTLQYDLSVTGVEANESNSCGANIRAKKYFSYWLKHSNNAELKKSHDFVKEKESKFNSIATFLSRHSDLTATTSSDRMVVTGLHACGDLSSNIISLFCSDSALVGMCLVGCCYHHNTEAFETENDFFPDSNTFLGTKSFIILLFA